MKTRAEVSSFSCILSGSDPDEVMATISTVWQIVAFVLQSVLICAMFLFHSNMAVNGCVISCMFGRSSSSQDANSDKFRYLFTHDTLWQWLPPVRHQLHQSEAPPQSPNHHHTGKVVGQKEFGPANGMLLV